MKREAVNNGKIIYIENKELRYMQFSNLKKYDGIITHCFTTRIGGVSSDECMSLNLGFNRNDRRENVKENYRRVCKALNIDCSNMVFSNQVHDNKIKIVDENDRGKGIIRKSDIIGYDGLVTNRKQVALVTFYADCVPVFFFDKEKKVIGMAHSGWRGTVKEIAKEALNKIKEAFDCNMENVEAALGPSIGQCCFEVGEEVYNEFINRLSWSKEYCRKIDGGKWYINLQGIITRTLVNSGIIGDNICVSGVCTKCNKDVFFSHRGDKGRTGSMAAIMQIN